MRFKYGLSFFTGCLLLTTSQMGLAGDVNELLTSHGWYAGLHGGLVLPEEPWQIGPAVGGQIGYTTGAIRWEMLFSYFYQTADNPGRTSSMATVLGNLYYDLNLSGRIVPFVGVGMGWLYGWTNNDSVTPDGNQFAYQATLGLRFPLKKNISLSVGYSYLGWFGSRHLNLIETGINYAFN